MRDGKIYYPSDSSPGEERGKLNALRTTAAMKWGHNLILLN